MYYKQCQLKPILKADLVGGGANRCCTAATFTEFSAMQKIEKLFRGRDVYNRDATEYPSYSWCAMCRRDV